MTSVVVPDQSVINETVGPFVTVSVESLRQSQLLTFLQGMMIQQLLMGVIVVQVYDYFVSPKFPAMPSPF